MTEGKLSLIWISLTVAFIVGVVILNQIWDMWRQIPIDSRFYFLLFMFAVVIALFIFLYDTSRRAKKLEFELSKKILKAREDEKRKISSELHDSLQQNLHSINFDIQRLAKYNPPIKWKLDEISERINESISDVRSIASAMYPHQLESLGLKKSLTAMANNLTHSTDIYFDTDISGAVESLLTREAAIGIYRIIQELCSNIVKHSDSSYAKIQMGADKSNIYINVSDDGKGINNEMRLEYFRNGSGITSVQHRVKLIHGTFHSESHPGKGTAFKIAIPVEKI